MPRVGDVYGHLTVIKANSYQDKHGARHSECLCTCGRKLNVLNCLLLGSGTQPTKTSCGSQHRLSNTITYESWIAMRTRCQNSQHVHYRNYGGRGIKVCERWDKSFLAFLTDMGERPNKYYSLDRINNNGNYEPSNCRWATPLEQANNTRLNHQVTYQGKTQTLAQWSRELNIKSSTLYSRFNRGWSIDRALGKENLNTKGA